MTNKQVAFVKGTGFDTIAGAPTYYRPGYDITVEEATINNNPTRRRQEDTVEPTGSTEGIFRAFLGLSWSMSADIHDDVRDIVFNDGGTGFTTGQPAFSRWFVGSEYFNTSLASNIVEIELRSGIPLNYSIQYEVETNTIRESARFGFADLRKNTAFTPGSITGPSADSSAPFHGHVLTIAGSTVNRDQASTLEFPEPMSRFRDEASRTAVNAVINGIDPTLSTTLIYHSDDYLGLSLSGDDTTATQPQSELGDVAAKVEYQNAAGTRIAEYSFTNATLETWQAQNLAAQDADFQGQAQWTLDGGLTINT